MNGPSKRQARGKDKPRQAPGGGALVEGVLQMKSRIGFVLSENPKVPDVLIEGRSLRLAMDGDRVRAKLIAGREQTRRYGEIVEVLERARDTVVGLYEIENGMPLLVPEEDGPPLELLDAGSPPPREHEVAVARITRWPNAERRAGGVLIEVLGERDLPGVDLLILRRKYKLPDVFPTPVETEASSWGAGVPAEAYAQRETFFDRNVFTIDGADAKDFDDAVSIEKKPGGGWRLGVHIADVSHYVREGSALDREARARGTSVYLKSAVVPMLPFALSDHLCSLVPGEVRLTLSCIMEIDKQGRILSSRLCESAIKSRVRFTYDMVEAILKGSPQREAPPDVQEDLKEMDHVARLLRERRFARGSLDFDFPEPDVQFDAHGRPVSIQTKPRLESHRLIEDFMLAANESVARHMSHGPFLYRIHESPEAGKIEKLTQTLRAIGIAPPKKLAEGEPASFQQVLSQVQGKPTERLVEMLTLRTLRQAVYSAMNRGHFGLASGCYTHFTSPIRRYPDLIVHRLVRASLRSGASVRHGRGPNHKEQVAELTAIAAECSRLERRAVEAEREYFDVLKVRLMRPHVGEEFEGLISGVTNFGFFVQLKHHFVEGLVRLANVKEDFFVFDEVRFQLRGRRTGLTFHLGQPVRVKLAAANLAKRQLDLEWIPERPRSGSGKKPRLPRT